MDKIDAVILRLLQANARMPGSEIARRVHLSLPAVTERLRKLNESGLILSYTIHLNKEALGWDTCAFIKVWLNYGESDHIIDQVLSLPEVLECHHIAGDYDLLLKVRVGGTAELEEFLVKRLKIIQGISRTSTTMVLGTYKESMNRPIEDE
ncbi:MAG: Lrp/AsnC family transcriptional regulator [Bacteroidota bacterium]